MSFVGTVRAIKVAPRVKRTAALYRGVFGNSERLKLQLDCFNQLWSKIRQDIPYYAQLAKERSLPQAFKSWPEFIDKFPITTKKIVQANTALMSYDKPKPEFYRVSGGTTAQPVQLPAWRSETRLTQMDTWVARSWYGINPDDKLFTIWSRSHTLGHGWHSQVNKIKRNTKDWLLGYCRVSAYDMTDANLKAAAKKLLRQKPGYIMGFSVALDLFARANRDFVPRFRKLKVKAVIGCSEMFPHPDSKALLADLFNCPVIMEYGAGETNLMGHSHPNGGYLAFWRNYFLEALEPREPDSRIVRVTSLYNRCFPLIRYEIGDELELYPGDDGLGVARFKAVRGRCNLFALLSDGTKVHSEAFTHCVRHFTQIASYQVVQAKGKVTIRIVANPGFNHEIEERIRGKLCQVHPELAQAQFQIVDKLEQTAIGKTPILIRQD